jgi:flagellar biosynthesis protein FlhG
MKLLSIKYHLRNFALIANSVTSEADGQGVYERLNQAAARFLQVQLRYLGPVPLDKALAKAVRQQRPVLELYPNAPASRALMRIAARLEQPGAALAAPSADAPAVSTSRDPALPDTFWDRLLHWKKVK